MVETFATSQYKEKFFGNLTITQSLILLFLAAPGVWLAVRGYPAAYVLCWGLLCVLAYAAVAFWGLDERVVLWLGFAASGRRLLWGTKKMREFVGVEDIDYDTVYTLDGRLLSVVKVMPKDLGGLGEQDIERVLAGYGTFLHELSTNIQIIMSSTEIDVDSYLQRLKEKVLLGGSPQRMRYFEHFQGFLRAVVQSKTVTDRDYYIVITQPKGAELKRALGDLDAKTRNLMASLADAGIDCERLDTRGLIGFFANFYNPRFNVGADAWSPVTFHDNIEGMLEAEEHLKRHRARGGLKDSMGGGSGSFERGGSERVRAGSDRRSSVLEQIMPSSVDIGKDCAEIEKLHRVLFTVRFPALVHPGWLTKLIRQPIDFDIVFHIHPLSQRTSIEYLQHEITKLETDVTAREREGLLVAEKDRVNLVKVKELLNRVSRDEEKCFDVALYVNVKAYTRKDLDLAVMRIKDVMEGMNAQVRVANWEMGDALRSCYPLAEDRLGERRDKLFPSSAVRDSYPFILSSLEDRGEGAIVAGYNQLNGIPVLLDIFQQPNPHVLVLGSSGSGKSFLVKKLVLGEALHGVDLFIIDPQGEYKKVVEHMGGQVIRLAHDSRSVINLFDISNDTYDGRKAAIKAFFNIVRGTMDERISGEAVGIIDKMVDNAYRKAGIYPDEPATWRNKPPTFSDVHYALSQFACENTSSADGWKKAAAEALLSQIAPFVEGDMRYLDQQTTVDLGGKNMVGFDISQASAFRPQERALVLFIVFDYINAWMRRQDKRRRKMIVVDEAWSVFENNQDYLGPIVRTGRKDNLGVVMIDQNVEDLLAKDESGRERGHVILNNTSTKFILRQEAAALKLVCEKFALTEGQRAFVQNASTGDVLFLSPSVKLPLFVLASDEEKRMLSTSPEEGRGNAHSWHSAGGACESVRGPVVPHAMLSVQDASRLEREGYVGLVDTGLSAGEESIYYVKKPEGEDAAHFLRKHLIFRHIEELRGRFGIGREALTLRMNERLMPDITFRLPGGGCAVEILSMDELTGNGGLGKIEALRMDGDGRIIYVALDERIRRMAEDMGVCAIMSHQAVAALDELFAEGGAKHAATRAV